MTKRGFGTNFHKVYGSNAKLYHSFSSAEHFSTALTSVVTQLMGTGVLLDVACGTCHKTNMFSSRFKKVYALDFSEKLLTFAQEVYKRNKKLNFIWSSADQIPLLDESIDTVLVTWGSFPLSRSIREMKRVLKRGGYIIRIGASGRDEFTSLFPDLDTARIRRINSAFLREGFTIEPHEVTIRFKNSAEARRILGKITGAEQRLITSPQYHHQVALCYYKKQ